MQRAKREGRSLNSLVTEALEAAAAGEDRRSAFRERARRLGLLANRPGPPPDPAARARVIEATRGSGSFVSEDLLRDRKRR